MLTLTGMQTIPNSVKNVISGAASLKEMDKNRSKVTIEQLKGISS